MKNLHRSNFIQLHKQFLPPNMSMDLHLQLARQWILPGWKSSFQEAKKKVVKNKLPLDEIGYK